jgi:DNA-binding NarL/FixJ family response regulator
MVQRIAIVGGKPTWQRGMEAMVADLGFGTVVCADLPSWEPGRGGQAVVVFISDDETLDTIVDFAAEYPHIPVVAVIPDLDLASLARAVRAGASGAIDDADPADELREVISSALRGRVSAPIHLARAMAQRIPPPPEISATVDGREAEWLQLLARGETVASLAEHIGYSERETYRMLGDLYQRLGVTNRTEAIIWATRHGVLDAAPGAPSV